MNLRQIEVFHAVYVSGSITAARPPGEEHTPNTDPPPGDGAEREAVGLCA